MMAWDVIRQRGVADMNNKILVAYASKHGATAEIAEVVGRELGEAGLNVEVLPIAAVKDVSVYDAIAIGSAVYAGQWRKEASVFLEANKDKLAERSVWLFSTGPTGEGDPVQMMKGWNFPDALRPVADAIKPREIAFFHGVLDMSKLNLGEKLIVKGIKAPVGDFRDWDAIKGWASSIAKEIQFRERRK
jgi:menaquinone-dependent protoporphyrinogen oxidase